jgi:PAS domain S-box-containing protein
MLSRVIKIFKSIIYSGVKPEYSLDEILKTRTTNFLALLAIVYCLIYNLIYFIFDFYILFNLNIVAIAFYISIFFINRYNRNLAQFIFYIILVINVVIASSFFGSKAQIHLLLFPISFIPFLLIDITNKTKLVSYLSIAFAAMSLLYFTDFSLLYNNSLSNEFINFLDAANKILSMLGSIIILYFFISGQNKSKKEYLSIHENLQNQLKSIFDNAFDAILLLDKKNGNIIRANQKAHELFEIENMTGLLNFSKKYLFNDKLYLSEIFSINKSIDIKGFWESEAQFLSSKGKIFWGSVSIKNIYINNQEAQLVRITDITEKKEIEIKLKESEQKYIGIFNASPDLVFILSKENGRLKFDDTNLIHEEFYTPHFGSFKGKYVDEVLPPEINNFSISKYKECFNKGETVKYEEQIFLPNGKKFWFYTILTPITNEHGKVIQILSSSRDITSLKETEENLKNALREKKVLLSEIHHRVKNNLAIVSGLLMLQSEKVKHADDYQLFEESRNRIHSMALIHETLYKNDDFSLIDFNKYLKDLIENIKNSYKLKNDVTIHLNVENVVLQIVVALPLGLLVNEILTNSFKHAFLNIDNPELIINFIKTDKNYELIIKDNGPGFDFENYKNNDTSLGTSLIFSLAEQINATVNYTYENGAKFCLTFKA